MLFYLMAASTGLETASFNIAYLCEEDPDKIVSRLFDKECVWRYYNQSVHADVNNAHGYALNKMGDYHYEQALNNSRPKRQISNDISMAIEFYSKAYRRGDPQVFLIH